MFLSVVYLLVCGELNCRFAAYNISIFHALSAADPSFRVLSGVSLTVERPDFSVMAFQFDFVHFHRMNN